MTNLRSDPASFAPRGSEESQPVREAVTQSRQGSREAVHFLYVRYAPDVHSGVRDLVRDDGEARAVTESVFRALVNLVDGYEPRREPFASWLLGVARDAAQERSAGRPFPRSTHFRLAESTRRRQ